MNSLGHLSLFWDWFGENSVYSLAEGDQDQKSRHSTAEKSNRHAGLFKRRQLRQNLARPGKPGIIGKKPPSLALEFSLFKNFLDKLQSKALVLVYVDGKRRITPGEIHGTNSSRLKIRRWISFGSGRAPKSAKRTHKTVIAPK